MGLTCPKNSQPQQRLRRLWRPCCHMAQCRQPLDVEFAGAASLTWCLTRQAFCDPIVWNTVQAATSTELGTHLIRGSLGLGSHVPLEGLCPCCHMRCIVCSNLPAGCIRQQACHSGLQGRDLQQTSKCRLLARQSCAAWAGLSGKDERLAVGQHSPYKAEGTNKLQVNTVQTKATHVWPTARDKDSVGGSSDSGPDS